MTQTRRVLPYGKQWIDDDDLAAVAATLRSELLTTGPAVAQFEQDLTRIIGASEACVCANGTAALHLMLMAAGIGSGDRIVVPSITFLATANAVRMVGAEVVFADVDPNTGLMTQDTAAAAAASGPVKALIPVHLNGQVANLQALKALADDLKADLFEDGCHALGSKYLSGGVATSVGACAESKATAFSFHPVKIIAMGEGGAVTTQDPEFAAKIRRLRSHGMVREPGEFVAPELGVAADGQANPWYYEMQELGYNYRASDIACSLGSSQLRKLNRFCDKRRALAAHYDSLIEPLFPKIRPLARLGGQWPCWHLYVIHVDFADIGIDRATLMRRLTEYGILTQVHYTPLHMQPYYRERYSRQELPGAEAYYEHCLSLPLFPLMEMGDVAFVVEALSDIVGRAGAI